MTSVIDALKRLERAGSEASRQSEKLKAAAGELSSYLTSLIPDEAGTIDSSHSITINHNAVTVWFNHEQGERIASGYTPSLTTARDLAAAVAGGWINEVAIDLEDQATRDALHAEILLAAATKLRS